MKSLDFGLKDKIGSIVYVFENISVKEAKKSSIINQ